MTIKRSHPGSLDLGLGCLSAPCSLPRRDHRRRGLSDTPSLCVPWRFGPPPSAVKQSVGYFQEMGRPEMGLLVVGSGTEYGGCEGPYMGTDVGLQRKYGTHPSLLSRPISLPQLFQPILLLHCQIGKLLHLRLIETVDNGILPLWHMYASDLQMINMIG